jgi:hypothetical protein
VSIKTPTSWDAAGLTRESTGFVDQPQAGAAYAAPERVELDVKTDRLYWAFGSTPEKARDLIRPSANLLTAFIELADADPDRILAYARRHGVLEICEHGLPRSHKPGPHVSGAPAGLFTCDPLGWHDRFEQPAAWWFGYEPLDAWRFWSRQARTVVNIAAELHLDRVGRPEDWKIVFERSPAPRNAPWWKQDVAVDRGQLARVVQEWLDIADVRPRAEWPQSGPSLRLFGRGLFGALSIQLLLSAWKTTAIAVCSSCGSAYAPVRRPRRTGRHYCEACRQKGVHKRDAARDYERRQRNVAHGGMEEGKTR